MTLTAVHIGLAIAALWLLRQGKRAWFAFVPAVVMLVTTMTNLLLMLRGFLAEPRENATLLIADVVILLVTVYLFAAGIREAVRFLARSRPKRPCRHGSFRPSSPVCRRRNRCCGPGTPSICPAGRARPR